MNTNRNAACLTSVIPFGASPMGPSHSSTSKIELSESTLEEWRCLDGYEGIYEISSLGRVRSVPRKITTALGRVQFYKGRVLRQTHAWTGYLAVHVSSENKGATISVHRAVALAFCERDDPAKNQVNHKNGIRDDNRSSNLEWVTARENAAHATSIGRRCPIRNVGYGNSKLTWADVQKIRVMYRRGDGVLSIAKTFGVARNTIKRIALKQTWAGFA